MVTQAFTAINMCTKPQKPSEMNASSLIFAVVAHNRFHFRCCENPPPRRPTVEEVKAQSLLNSVKAQKRRRERSNQRQPGLKPLVYPNMKAKDHTTMKTKGYEQYEGTLVTNLHLCFETFLMNVQHS